MVSSGTEHTCGILLWKRRAACFGSNGYGQVDGTADQELDELHWEAEWWTISAGKDHTCGVKVVNRAASCFGGSDNTIVSAKVTPPVQNGWLVMTLCLHLFPFLLVSHSHSVVLTCKPYVCALGPR